MAAKVRGFPWYWPDKCGEMPNPSDDLLGDGVTKVDDDVTGSPDQWGYLDGFVPGAKAWVLSTGLVGNAQGSPGSFASTDLGLPGDTQLSSHSGHPTYDAGSYTAMLIPSGTTLHVRYAFASEEYPEYVGSVYNDVMAVFVDGQNCAFVPGTTTPVSINSINDHTNEQYYVDNSSGASGYNAAFDGITVPLECSVPVTPGKPVTVRIALADASDGAFDSAVALLDGGIWSD